MIPTDTDTFHTRPMYLQEYQNRGLPLWDAFGTRYPAAFTHPLREYRALTGKVGLIDLSHWGAVRLRGADRVTFLNSQITNEVATLAVGEACHAALTTTKGKLIAELFVLFREEELFVLVAQGETARVIESLDQHIIADDVLLEDVSNDFVVLSVEGPKSRELVWRLFPEGPLPMEPLAFGDADYQGMPVTVLRNSVTGQRGFQLIVSGDGRRLVRNYLVQAGMGFDMEECGGLAWDMRRVENGLPWWGRDITPDNFPAECRLDDLVNYEKGCFLGQETLARMHHRGHPNWKLVGLVPSDGPGSEGTPAFISEEKLPVLETNANDVKAHIDWLMRERLGGTELFSPEESSSDGAKPLGRLTSPVFSPALGGLLTLGLVRQKLSETGTHFEARIDGAVVALTVISLPVPEEKSAKG